MYTIAHEYTTRNSFTYSFKPKMVLVGMLIKKIRRMFHFIHGARVERETTGDHVMCAQVGFGLTLLQYVHTCWRWNKFFNIFYPYPSSDIINWTNETNAQIQLLNTSALYTQSDSYLKCSKLTRVDFFIMY